jgi:carbamate kinase
MRIVVALGGNALLRRGEPMTEAAQRGNAKIAAAALAAIRPGVELVVTHGNGPQIGLLALQAAVGNAEQVYPLDILGAETEGMIGYTIERELRNHVPPEVPIVTVLTMVEVDGNAPEFCQPKKFIGPICTRAEADRQAASKGWVFRQDSSAWRRVVASPPPRRILEIQPISWLLEKGAIVIAAGGGGIPTVRDPDGRLRGVEAVIDKDLCSELLARELDSHLLLMATDVDAVYTDWGLSTAKAIRLASPQALASYDFAAGSMGPKVEAACRFAAIPGKIAAIGALKDLAAIIRGEAGTTISKDAAGIAWYT